VLTAFVAVLGWSRASYVEYVTDAGLATILACHRRAFDFFGGVPRAVLYESSHTVFARPDAYGPDRHHFHTAFLDFARQCGFLPRLFASSRHKTKADVERMVRYLRYSFHLPLLTRLARIGLDLDADTANVEVRRWLRDVVNAHAFGATGKVPAKDLPVERKSLLPLPPPWATDNTRGQLHAAIMSSSPGAFGWPDAYQQES
jgi:transposase